MVSLPLLMTSDQNSNVAKKNRFPFDGGMNSVLYNISL